MNFQANEFLNDLNLDFDQSPALSDGMSHSDLDLFSQAEFFDLDAFSKLKPVTQVAGQVPAGQHHHVASVKSEPDLSLDFLNLPEHDTGSPVQEAASPVSSSATQDKRKRNTAASARFRIKKKMKEQEMEKKSKELQERLTALEKKLKTLEMENKCLKNLILEQNEQKNSELLESIKRRSILDSKPVFQFTN
ncbi:uncharacterized protein CANTADRAFT_90187 [Suhomyces tanzawaensis NRRL Y-17324]|uniref:BZIP domain-containing protein n=1 Tax=Suhomyces tanzawaensis NRRL Y-17324 TaxID=984487 RepID=A0A1E4SI14_9ASCO|nr:uncharacterized protein CANTADRAFT_90187 [Suhomyces tanzawaensis NRRL Y-17324]ODV79072.1 hypothetical protein CANTADRAFT_90187 [Suhomyces tanzawaensis NRRL Y-17324]